MRAPNLNHSSTAYHLAWDALRNGAMLPHTSEFLARGPYRMMKDTFILESVPQRQLVRFMGTSLVNSWCADLTDKCFLDAVQPAYRNDARGFFADVDRTPAGAALVVKALTIKRLTIDIGLLVLPLAVDDGKPARQAAYALLPELSFDDLIHSIQWSARPQWIDLGRGTPERR